MARPGAWMAGGRAWPLRIGIAIALLVLAVFVVRHSLAYSMRGQAPEMALGLAPYDARVQAIAAEALQTPEASREDQLRAKRLATNALRRQLLNPSALATLAMEALARGDLRRSRAIANYSQRISRRDLRTQIFLIEDAVAANDISGALRHYNIALSTVRTAPGILFPILRGAVDDPAIREPLARLIIERPEWANNFIEDIAENGANPVTAAALFARLHQLRYPIPPSADATLSAALVAQGNIDAAWRYYAATRTNAHRDRNRNPRFEESPALPGPFDWKGTSDDGLSILSEPGAVEYQVSGGRSGPLLSQMQVLPPGQYRFQTQVASVQGADKERPYWTVTCTDGPELMRSTLPKGDGAMDTSFAVPAGCASQQLTLTAPPPDDLNDLSGRIMRAEISQE